MKGLEALENCLLAKRGGGGKAALAMDGDGEKNEDECQWNRSSSLLLLPMFHTNAEERFLLGNRAFYKWFLKENEREAGGDDSSVFAIFLGLFL